MIIDIPYIERYVSDLNKETSILSEKFGFDIIGENKKSNGDHSTILHQGNIRIILTSGPNAGKEVELHASFIKDVAFRVKDIKQAYESATQSGFRPLLAPMEYEGRKIAQIGSCGSLIHTLIETSAPINREQDNPSLFDSIDHIAIAVDDLQHWTNIYETGLGLREFTSNIIKTNKTGMKSRVLRSEASNVTLFFASPEEVLYKSQIDKFLEENNSPGVQHLALSTNSIIQAIATLKSKGIGFVSPPDNYYDNIPKSLQEKFKDIFDDIRDLQIFIDQDYNGEMMQTFTHPMQDRATFFFEIIERQNAVTFGQNNILALFKALEKQFENA